MHCVKLAPASDYEISHARYQGHLVVQFSHGPELSLLRELSLVDNVCVLVIPASAVP